MKPDFRTFSDLPKSFLRPFNLDEVAAVVDVDRKVVVRMTKKGGFPKSVFSRSKKAVSGSQQMLKPIACPIVHFDLAVQLRRRSHLRNPHGAGGLNGITVHPSAQTVWPLANPTINLGAMPLSHAV